MGILLPRAVKIAALGCDKAVEKIELFLADPTQAQSFPGEIRGAPEIIGTGAAEAEDGISRGDIAHFGLPTRGLFEINKISPVQAGTTGILTIITDQIMTMGAVVNQTGNLLMKG
ncbi:MAG: hypothetical protein Sw2PiMacB_30980 [Shewanella algae]